MGRFGVNLFFFVGQVFLEEQISTLKEKLQQQQATFRELGKIRGRPDVSIGSLTPPCCPHFPIHFIFA